MAWARRLSFIVNDDAQRPGSRAALEVRPCRPEVVVVVGEICDITPNAMAHLHAIAASGPVHGMSADGPQIALTLRSDYRRQERDARLRLAELLLRGPETGLARAEELYSSLCAEDPEDERLWTALFRVHERAGSLLGLESAVRKLRFALAELAPGEPDVDTMPLPPKLDSLINEIRDRLGRSPVRAS